ncbi:MAG: hypothetical protein IJL80_04010 [Treponema sp.]|nr:hypothetical protein [Treponema sp.]
MNKTKLALVFPGLGYGPDRPLLYYAGKLARKAGYNLVTLSYGELPRVERPAPGKPLDTGRLGECFRLALERSASRLDGVLGKEEMAEEAPGILIISKSIGTAVGAAWAESRGIVPRQILYTPVSRTFDFPLARSVAFHGTADPWIRTGDCVAGCRNAGVPLHLFEGADHSLECGDVEKSIRHLAEAVRLTAGFIGGSADGAVPGKA